MSQAKKILVLGGTRYFGRSIVEELVSLGHQVTVFTRGNLQPEILNQVNHIAGDRRDFSSFKDLFRNKTFDVLIDNIGYLPDEVEFTLDFFQGKVGLYIYTSSISAYNVDKFKPSENRYLQRKILNEDDYQPIPGSLSAIHNVDTYCLGKNQCELRVMKNKDLPFVILRPPLVIGPDDHSRNLYFFLQRILDGGPVILPQHLKHDLLHIYEKDLASVYPKFLEKKSSWNKAYNIAGEEVLTSEEYFGYIANYINKDLKIIYLPQADLDSINYIQPFEFNLISDISLIKKEIGIELTSFKIWMGETIEWYLTKYDGGDSKGYSSRQQEIDLAKKNV